MTEKRKKQVRILVLLVILLFIWYWAVKDERVEGGTGSNTGDDDDYPLECQSRDLIECFSSCPNPQASFFKTEYCGVSDLCGDSTGHPNYQMPPCAPPPNDPIGIDPVLGEDDLVLVDNTTTTITGGTTGGQTPIDNTGLVVADPIGNTNVNTNTNTGLPLDNSGFGLGTYGCTDANAINYDPQAGADDGSCYYTISTNDTSSFGCCNPLSPNFDSACYNNTMCNCVSYMC